MELTRKERWLRSIRGEEVDRLVFWPKIFNQSYMQNQIEPYHSMSIQQVHDYIGSDIQSYVPDYIIFQSESSTKEEMNQGNHCIKRFHTKCGSLENILRYDETTDSYHPVKMPVETREDILILTEYFKSITPVVDFDRLEDARKMHQEFGNRGLTADNISESPFMDFVEWYAGIENAQYLLMDYPDEVEELLAQMQRVNKQITELKVEYSPADVLYFTENTSTTIISPSQFSQYCKPFLTEYADLCNQAGRLLIYHMCGHLKIILKEIDAIPFTGIEALSSPPIGNTTFSDAREIIKNKCLIGGTNCLTWIKSVDEIKNEIQEYLNQLENHRGIILGTGGVIPPQCSPETLKQIREYIQTCQLRF